MSAYENVVGGKLKLKGKALDVKSGSIKKKKKQKKHFDEVSETKQEEKLDGENADVSTINNEEGNNVESENNDNESVKSSKKGKAPNFADYLTPAEKRYIEQREQLDVHKYTKMSKNSHRDRLDDFNQYLANLSEHYDIPKVGPG